MHVQTAVRAALLLAGIAAAYVWLSPVAAGKAGAAGAEAGGSGVETVEAESGPEDADGAVERTLVVMLDGVSYSVVDSLRSAGHFEGFSRPSRVVSPFPSLTGVSFPAMWGEDPPPGYEDLYFDPSANRMRGGLVDHLLEPNEHAGFRRHVDIEAAGAFATLGYVFPEALAAAELRSLREETRDLDVFDDRVVVAYLVATDALAHRAGRDAVVEVLLELERLLAEVRERHGPELRITLFSDHGNNFVPSRRVALGDSLRAAGFELTDRISDENDVVLPGFGLVGSSFLFSWPELDPRIAASLVDVQGVDLVAYEDSVGRVHVRDAVGGAVIERREGDGWYRYIPQGGDPLELAATARRFRETGVADSAGFAPDSAWFAATLDGPYVDALRRLVRGVRGVVRHPASVVVSYEPGYYFGDPAADALVDVAGTHGSLRTASSLAFFMSTHASAPAVLRGDELPRHLPRTERSDGTPAGRRP